jgi:hypothetical protein
MSRFQKNLTVRDLNVKTTLNQCKKKIFVMNSLKRYYASETKVIRSNERIEKFPTFEINTHYTCCGLHQILIGDLNCSRPFDTVFLTRLLSSFWRF